MVLPMKASSGTQPNNTSKSSEHSSVFAKAGADLPCVCRIKPSTLLIFPTASATPHFTTFASQEKIDYKQNMVMAKEQGLPTYLQPGWQPPVDMPRRLSKLRCVSIATSLLAFILNMSSLGRTSFRCQNYMADVIGLPLVSDPFSNPMEERHC
jgi:hypothetical protein